METTITFFDWIVFGVVGVSALLALFRGFIREVLSLVGWIAAAWVTMKYYSSVADIFKQHIESNLVANGMAALALFFGVLILVSIVNAIVMRFLHAGGQTSFLDAALGAVFGFLRGAFILSLSFVMISVVLEKDDYPDWLAKSITLPYVEQGADILASIAPEKVKELRAMSKEAEEKGEALRKAQDQMDKLPRDADGNLPNYNEKDLERLLNTLQREGEAPELPKGAP